MREKVAVSDLPKIARVVYLGQITNIESGCARELKNERSRDGRDISIRNYTHEKGCCLRIAQNRTGSIFRPNNEYSKRSCVKIFKGALPEGPKYCCAQLGV